MSDKVRFLWLFFLLLFIVVLPLAKFSPFALEFEFTKFIVFYFFGAILLFFTGIYFFKNEKIEIPSRQIYLPLLIFLAIYIVASIFSVSPITSLIGYFGSFTGGLIYILFLGVVFYSGFILQNERKLILQTIFLSGFLVSAYGLWQYANNYLVAHQLIFRIYSTIGQPNRLAFFLLAVLPIGFFLLLEEKRKILKISYAVGLIVTLLAFFLTFSRSAYAILLIVFGLILYNICHCEPREAGRGNLIKFKIASHSTSLRVNFLAMTVILLFLLFGFVFARSIPSTITNFSQSSLSLRLAEWQGSANAIINRPLWRQLIGYGPETVYFTFFKYRPQIYNQSPEEFNVGPNQIRNYYLHLLSGVGLIGLLAYLFFYKKILKLSLEQGKTDKLMLGIFFSFIGIAIYSFFYYQTDTVLPLFWFLVGMSVPKVNNNSHSNNTYYYSKQIAGVIFILLSGLSFYGLYRVSLGHYYASQIPSESNFIKATKFAPFFDVYQRNLSKFYMSEMMLVKDKDKKAAKEKFFLSQRAAQQALQILPLDIRNIRQLLLTQYFAGVNLDKKYHQGNIELAQKLAELSPSDPLSWDFLGLVYLDLGKLEEAKTAFGKEKTLNPHQPGVYLHLGEVFKQQGKIQEAIELYKKAVSLAPGWDFAEKELKKALEL